MHGTAFICIFYINLYYDKNRFEHIKFSNNCIFSNMVILDAINFEWNLLKEIDLLTKVT